MTDMSLAQMSGLLGVFLYLAGYAALQFGFLRGQTYTYAGLNLAAAAAVLLSLTESYNQSSALIQISWIVISIIGILRLYYIEKTLRFSEEETRLIEKLLPGVSKERAQKVLALGEWVEMRSGERVISEGVPTEALAYIASGTLVVSRGGIPLVTMDKGALVGEVTYLDGAPATAQIDVLEDARLFSLNAAKLRALVEKDSEVANAIERSVASVLRGKLQSTSQELQDRTSGFLPKV